MLDGKMGELSGFSYDGLCGSLFLYKTAHNCYIVINVNGITWSYWYFRHVRLGQNREAKTYMKIARCIYQGKEIVGKVEDGVLIPMTGDLFGEHSFKGQPLPMAGMVFLPPTSPSKILAAGLNYRDHAEEMGIPIPKWPNVFIKPNSALTGHNRPVYLPAKFANRVDYEAELVVVIGKTARHVSVDRALDYVLGYTCGNDVTARNMQSPDSQWSLCKGFDTFAPLGPWIETELDPGGLDVKMIVNNEIRQHTNTNNLIFDVPYLVSYLSDVMTLLPGDVIFTGTSSGIGPVYDGDIMEVRINGIGALVNRLEQEAF